MKHGHQRINSMTAIHQKKTTGSEAIIFMRLCFGDDRVAAAANIKSFGLSYSL